MGQDPRLMELGATHDRTFPVERPRADVEREVADRLATLKAERDAVCTLIDERKDDIVSCLQELVRIPSVNPSPEGEKPLADYVARLMREMDMEVQQIEPLPTRVSNLGVLAGTRRDRSLLYYAHLDTVAAGDESEWRFPPFSAEVADGRVWGRGTKDCKLGMAAALMAIHMIREAGIRLAGDIQLVTPADEEAGGYWGLAQMVSRGMIKADWAIYGEGRPDSITIGHRGNAKIDVTTHGKTAHTAWKNLGDNAILKMCEIAPAIDQLEYHGWKPHPIIPGGVTGSVNLVRGGVGENVVPDRCTITVDIRFPPGVNAEMILDNIHSAISRVQSVSSQDVTVTLRRYGRPSYVPKDLPLVIYMQRTVEAITGRYPVAEGMEASSDSRWLVLDAGIPTVNFSMGNSSGHMPNEWAGIQDLLDTTKVYATMALLLLTD